MTSVVLRKLAWITMTTCLLSIGCDQNGSSPTAPEKAAEQRSSGESGDDDDGNGSDESSSAAGAVEETERDGDEAVAHKWLTETRESRQIDLRRTDADQAMTLLANAAERQVIALGHGRPLLVSGSWTAHDADSGLMAVVDAMGLARKEVDVPGLDRDLLLVTDEEAFDEELDLGTPFADVGDVPLTVEVTATDITNILRLIQDGADADDGGGFAIDDENISAVPAVTAVVSKFPLSAFLEAVVYATGSRIGDANDEPVVEGFAAFAEPQPPRMRCPTQGSPFDDITGVELYRPTPVVEMDIDELYLSSVRVDDASPFVISDGRSMTCPFVQYFVTRPAEDLYHLWEVEDFWGAGDFDGQRVTVTNIATQRDGEVTDSERSVALEFPDVSD